jgi:hypothetical protein
MVIVLVLAGKSTRYMYVRVYLLRFYVVRHTPGNLETKRRALKKEAGEAYIIKN